jgi:hypothetical protein
VGDEEVPDPPGVVSHGGDGRRPGGRAS